ncbi:MAG: S4 domain-containing protein YaaA [Bacillota bacterium]|jgi:ribosome-associated protein|nr:S4 domain-containing protein YaaA [Bacillota bacterium]NLU55744.1 S4 domain-containing protein YaaA [Bacillota bacterium]HOA91608.1 S4 domain-containing protein YaaA [Bacillota bacterium]HOJ45761.1 S4 domain-containing protein YaaA [Bacillota bacterium]HOP54712.1 S4 domain-containing protein YaaA [Bacillota bacterium]
MEPVDVVIKTETIKLEQFLKWAGVVQTGGEAKLLIQDGYVYVNGEEELRRGRQLKEGDLVEIEGSGKFKVAK